MRDMAALTWPVLLLLSTYDVLMDEGKKRNMTLTQYIRSQSEGSIPIHLSKCLDYALLSKSVGSIHMDYALYWTRDCLCEHLCLCMPISSRSRLMNFDELTVVGLSVCLSVHRY